MARLRAITLRLIVYDCHGTGAVTTRRMYLRSLQDVAQSIVRVEGVRG